MQLEIGEALTPKQAADICGVDRTTVRRWLLDGVIPHSVTPGGWRRIAPADLLAFMQEHAMPVPAGFDPGPGRVLLVDDERSVTQATTRALHRYDPKLEVRAVHDGFGAGVLALSFSPHVIVLDLMMPGLDGFEVCRWVMAEPRLSGVAVVVLSGQLDRCDDAQLTAFGAKAILCKPVAPDVLYQNISLFLPSVGGTLQKRGSPVG